ncbi:hypothetical protein HYC85_014253 [Camellia sinensis]|uniref:Uncharacterized protein n=1 Tax=Camellia sinensis TaxID=4442 RepID=A0A7J7H972_CAMSI|nr:hypothetical protein HYC85_014253 [Camellia sinensis]
MNISKIKKGDGPIRFNPSEICWAIAAPNCYPSTAESERLSLLCEASLTQYPPL